MSDRINIVVPIGEEDEETLMTLEPRTTLATRKKKKKGGVVLPAIMIALAIAGTILLIVWEIRKIRRMLARHGNNLQNLLSGHMGPSAA